ncbi:MAG: hypothetical protein ACK55I_35090, partial [bacterium]
RMPEATPHHHKIDHPSGQKCHDASCGKPASNPQEPTDGWNDEQKNAHRTRQRQEESRPPSQPGFFAIRKRQKTGIEAEKEGFGETNPEGHRTRQQEVRQDDAPGSLRGKRCRTPPEQHNNPQDPQKG